jgi:hypothetical protein
MARETHGASLCSLRERSLLVKEFLQPSVYVRAVRSVADLRDVADPAIDLIRDWIREAIRPVELLTPGGPTDGVLHRLQVTRHSTLGALAADTGGLLVDHGWLRHLGGGSARVRRDLATWNGVGEEARCAGAMLVADDVLGGFFAINGGGLPGKPGNMGYLAPDSLRWEPMKMGHSEFVHWSLTGKLEAFYEGQRWDGWEAEVPAIPGDRALSIYPFLWAKGPPIAERSRRAVPIEDLWSLWHELAVQLGG